MPDGGNSPLEITCEGPFLFDLAGGVATFEDQVDVLRLNPDGPSDQLNCRLLEIHFDGLTPIGRGRVAKEAISASKVSKIVALGFPVVLQSPSLGAQARGERLVYDLAQRQFRLDGEQPVMLEHQGRRIEALAVQYQVPEQGRFGRAWAQGPGNFRASLSPDQSGQPPRVVTASWQDELRLRRDGANHVLSLAGEARVGDGQVGSLAAGEIHLWLKDVADANQVAEDNASEARNILPDRLLAEHAVQLESPALTGSTDRFEVWFQHVPPHALAQSEPPDDEQDPLRPRRQQNPRRQQDPRRPASQFDVSGKVLRVLLATAGKDVQLRDVSVEGDARIVETKTAQPGNEPVRIAGDFVHLSAADSPQAKAVVAGEPALVSGRGVTLKGASVHLDRAANRVWIPGDGEATLPLSGALGGLPSSSAQAGMRRFPPRRAIYRPGATTVSSLRRPRRAPQPRAALRPATAHEAAASVGQQTATVTWQEGMQFDGSTVQLRGGVIARTQQQRLAAPMVDISLTKSLDFSEPPRATAIDVQEIRLRGQVTMENRTIEQGELVSVDEMMVRDLTIDQQTGDLSADGPGWIKTVRRGGDLGPSPFTGPAAGNTNMPQDEAAEDGSDDGLTYLRVTFQTAMTGNVHQRHVELHESVRAVYGKVAQWTDTIDPDLALETEEDVVLLTSDTLQVAEMNPPAGAGESEQSPQQSRRKLGPVELQALGNAMVEGRTFTARAHRIAYAQAKDLLVMEGDGRTDAELYRQSHVGGQTGRAAARKILYWPSTGRMDVDTFSSLNWAGPAATSPGGENPLPGGVRDYLQRERESRPQRTSAPPR